MNSSVRSGRSRVIAELTCVLMFVCMGFAQSNVAAVSIELRTMGYTDLPSDFKYLALRAVNGHVAFVDANRVAVSFLLPNKDGGLTTREELRGGRWLFHTVLLNLESGMPERSWTWRTATPDSRFFPLSSNEFVVSSGERISSETADGTTIWHLDLPRTDILRAQPYGFPVLSYTGKTLYVISDRTREIQTVEVYQTLDGKKKAEFIIPQQGSFGFQTASDAGLTYAPRDLPYELRMYVLGPDASSRSLLTCQSQCGLHAQFVDADRLVVDEAPHSLVLVDVRGKPLQKRDLGNEVIGSAISVSSNGARILVKLSKQSRGSSMLDHFPRTTGARLAVLDAATLKEIASLKLDMKYEVGVKAGISPSGDLVAYLENGILRVWKVNTQKEGR